MALTDGLIHLWNFRGRLDLADQIGSADFVSGNSVQTRTGANPTGASPSIYFRYPSDSLESLGNNWQQGSWTVAFWIKRRDLVPPNYGLTASHSFLFGAGPAGNESVQVGCNSGGIPFAFGTSNTTVDWPACPTPINDDQWHLLIAASNGLAIKLYVDGVTGPFSSSASNSNLETNYRFFFGDPSPTEENVASPDVADLMIWNRMITLAEMDTLWNSGNGYAWPLRLDAPPSITLADLAIDSLRESIALGPPPSISFAEPEPDTLTQDVTLGTPPSVTLAGQEPQFILTDILSLGTPPSMTLSAQQTDSLTESLVMSVPPALSLSPQSPELVTQTISLGTPPSVTLSGQTPGVVQTDVISLGTPPSMALNPQTLAGQTEYVAIALGTPPSITLSGQSPDSLGQTIALGTPPAITMTPEEIAGFTNGATIALGTPPSLTLSAQAPGAVSQTIALGTPPSITLSPQTASGTILGGATIALGTPPSITLGGVSPASLRQSVNLGTPPEITLTPVGLSTANAVQSRIVINLADFEIEPDPIYEATTPIGTATLEDNDAIPINPGLLQAALFEVRDTATGALTRPVEDSLHSADFVWSIGTVSWYLQSQDTYLLNRDNTSEGRSIDWRLVWGATGGFGEVEDAASTTLASQDVTLTIPNHGLANDQHHNIFLHASETVGGHWLFGAFNIRPEDIIDANTLKVRMNCPAAANQSNVGGTIRYWLNASNSAATFTYSPQRFGKSCPV